MTRPMSHDRVHLPSTNFFDVSKRPDTHRAPLHGVGHMRAIVFDIDGTLADLTHRLHFIRGTGSPDYRAFFKACVDDAPINEVIVINHALRSYQRHIEDTANETSFAIVVASGRSDEVRAETAEWLSAHFVAYDALYMRKAGDTRSDVVIKQEILEQMRADGYEPSLVFDDRQRVVDMWRENGIRVAQVAPGDFDEKKKWTRYGAHNPCLHLLVGPSGAGKSRFAHDSWPAAMIVSSDDLRQEITGDFRRQDANDQVFSALHALVKTRIEHGLDTVVDATNLRRRDRMAIVKQVSPETDVRYWIIDRPMEDKHRDAGWRESIEVRDMSLIEYHAERFKSAVKDALKGDDQPNVTVRDMRAS